MKLDDDIKEQLYDRLTSGIEKLEGGNADEFVSIVLNKVQTCKPSEMIRLISYTDRLAKTVEEEGVEEIRERMKTKAINAEKTLDLFLENPEEIVNLREIARRVKKNPGSISRIIPLLVENNILKKIKVGKTMHVYQLNKEDKVVNLIMDFYEKLKNLK